MDRENRKALLTVSFGTSVNASGHNSAEYIEKDLRSAFPDRRSFRAWTSRVIRKKMAEKGIAMPSVTEAMLSLEQEGIRDVLVQPTHMLYGEEYQRIADELRSFTGRFESISLGAPLLSDRRDAEELCALIEKIYLQIEGGILVLMGHGSSAMTFPAYEIMQEQFAADGRSDICIGTVESEPGFGPVADMIKELRPRIAILAPLLVSAGGHVLNDMASDSGDSWKNRIASLGPEVVCRLNGLGEFEGVRAMYVRHANEAQELSAEVQR